ncbi:hypothetical protein [Acinetobacter seifertii]|uniref:hypothetical protein n=1 Tax=Acinetobacter seifertii TaxID=1530123 RepID=UPI000668EAD7|nr:hypothetical protein [Acinetobacter seifertii]
MTVETEAQDIVDPATTENNSAASQESEEQKQQTQEPEVEQTEEEKAKAAEEAEEKKRSRAKERIEQLVRKSSQAEERAKQLEAELERYKGGTKASTDAPRVEDFDDYSEYQQAQQEWFIKQAEQRVLDKLNTEKASQQQVQAEAEYQTAMAELESEGVDVASLIEKSNSLPPLPITLDQFGMSAKDTLGLAQTLLSDEDLYYELARMNPVQAAAKIGQIIGNKTAKSIPPASKAPAPIKPVTANAPASRDPEKMSIDEWMNQRNEQLKNRK